MVLLPQEKQQKKHYSLQRILLLLSISYITVGLCNNGFLSLLPFISEEFVLTRVQIGYYSSCYFISAALLAIFSGNIVDKFGPKKSILWGMGCMGIALFCHGLSASYQFILFLAIFTGLGMSILTPSVIKGTAITAPLEKQGFYLGIVQSGYSVGSIAGASLLPILAINYDWRISVQSTAAFTLLIGFLIYIFYQEQKVIHKNINSLNPIDISEKVNRTDKKLSFKDSLTGILKNKSLFLICILGIVFGVAEGSTFSHFTIFLSADMGMNPIIAGLGFATLYIGGIIGLTGWGWISDSFFRKNRRVILFLIGLLDGIMFLIFSFFPINPQINPVLIMICIFLLGLVVIGWPGAYFVVVGKLAGENHAGMATGLALFFIRTGILLAPISFGYLADLNGNYQYSWLFFGIFIITISSLFLLKDKKI